MKKFIIIASILISGCSKNNINTTGAAVSYKFNDQVYATNSNFVNLSFDIFYKSGKPNGESFTYFSTKPYNSMQLSFPTQFFPDDSLITGKNYKVNMYYLYGMEGFWLNHEMWQFDSLNVEITNQSSNAISGIFSGRVTKTDTVNHVTTTAIISDGVFTKFPIKRSYQ